MAAGAPAPRGLSGAPGEQQQQPNATAAEAGAGRRPLSASQVIGKLQGQLAAAREQLSQALADHNALRVRAAAIGLIARVQAEVLEVQASLGLATDPAALAALAVGSEEGSTSGALPPAGEARPPAPPPPQQQLFPCGSQGADSDGGAAAGSAAEERGAADDGVAAGGAAVGSVPATEGAAVLELIPHLAEGQPLLNLEGVTPEEVAGFQRMDFPAACAAWKLLMVAMLQHQAAGAEQECVETGRRITRFWDGMILFNPLLYLKFQSTHLVTGQPAAALEDGSLQLWESMVRAVRFTRLQAMLITEVARIHFAQLARISEHRAQIVAAMEAETAAAASGDISGLQPSVLMEELQETMAHERRVLVLVGLSLCPICRPEQFGKMMALSYPLPCNMRKTCNIIDHFLRLEPEALEEGDMPTYL